MIGRGLELIKDFMRGYPRKPKMDAKFAEWQEATLMEWAKETSIYPELKECVESGDYDLGAKLLVDNGYKRVVYRADPRVLEVTKDGKPWRKARYD